MSKLALTICTAAILLTCALASAEPFFNPPETSGRPWDTPFPYQRNMLIDFSTDPGTWPTDPFGPPGSKDLIPGFNYHLEGVYDPELYQSDWIDIQGAEYLTTFDQRDGLIGLTGEEQSMSIVWHMDNLISRNEFKRVWIEFDFYLSGSLQANVLVTPGPGSVLVDSQQGSTFLGGDWWRYNGWWEIKPNPEWEEWRLDVATSPTNPTEFYIDYLHGATECTPEPASAALFGAGLLALVIRRRRKAA